MSETKKNKYGGAHVGPTCHSLSALPLLPSADPDLFFAILGGVGQFGVITRGRARIPLSPCAPTSENPTQNPVALLQLCVDRRCLIFPFLHTDYVPGSLRRFITGAADCFVGLGVDKEAERLSDDHGLPVGNTADLRPLAA
uniref:Uncharacterized protein n=1 Tax=Oryza sativa subsp. japonica TaxID=39947 RepID=Q6K2J7_ORYSJ|nr:hypothetical protein [Oryza sativa Japonica Group]BAD22475.1 hypothetical protein [Oryza sativa Japonica Group]